jgi:hypothetical protein
MGRHSKHFPSVGEHIFSVSAVVFVVVAILLFGLGPQIRRWRHQRLRRKLQLLNTKNGGSGEIDSLLMPFGDLENRAAKGDVRAQGLLVNLLAYASKERVGKLRERLAKDEKKVSVGVGRAGLGFRVPVNCLCLAPIKATPN